MPRQSIVHTERIPQEAGRRRGSEDAGAKYFHSAAKKDKGHENGSIDGNFLKEMFGEKGTESSAVLRQPLTEVIVVFVMLIVVVVVVAAAAHHDSLHTAVSINYMLAIM